MAKKFTLQAAERLKRRKIIDQLFSEGKSVTVFPLRLQYKLYTEAVLSDPLQTGFSASSRNFKRAVDRNRIKRLLREAYRLQKIPLQEKLQEQQKQMALFFIYTGRELPEYALIYEKMGVALNKLIGIL